MLPLLRALALSCIAWAAPCIAAPDATTADGAAYYGPLVNGKLHGRGRLEWRNGDVYEGGFADGLMSGLGRMVWRNGITYEGDFRDGMMAGRGKMRMPDGSTYEGEFHEDYYSGRGRFETPGREIYEGEFQLGNYSGQGTVTYSDGRKYTGQFERGLFQGKGRFENPGGEIYEGEFREGEFSGRGTQTRKEGSRYEGQFANWRFQGEGRYADEHGNVYEGRFTDGVLNGSGKFSSKEGMTYEGELRNWRPHGQGVQRMPNGDVYRGGFADGLFEGQGTLTYAKPRPGVPREQAGLWRYGRLGDDEQRAKRQAGVESALYAQRALLDRALGALEPRQPGRINLYLLAVAGDGSQEVFRREVEFVRDQFAARFGTAARTITLVNSRNTIETLPMATVTSVREALNALAARMDREQDILFVFLTSHGSQKHDLTLGQNGMDLRDLSAAQLGELLAGSGIRWKVVVVSACYAGGFAEPLQSDGTLLIAAARRDRRSFGCADENDFTYFGRAFFKQALPGSSSFHEAFRKADALVAERETSELKAGGADDEQRSLPQLFSAPAIERQLARWWSEQSAAKR